MPGTRKPKSKAENDASTTEFFNSIGHKRPVSRAAKRMDSGRFIYGVSAGPETTLAIRDLFASDGRIEGLFLYHEVERKPAGDGLSRLMALLADGRLRTHIDIDDSWEKIGSTAARLIGRAFHGKAVLRI